MMIIYHRADDEITEGKVIKVQPDTRIRVTKVLSTKVTDNYIAQTDCEYDVITTLIGVFK